MTKRAALLVVALIFLLPGCPGNQQLLGAWTLTNNFTDYAGFTLNANGTATAFPIDFVLTGDLRWEVNGDMFILHRDTGIDKVIYVGKLVNTSVTGGFTIWDGPGSGSGGGFSASKQ